MQASSERLIDTINQFQLFPWSGGCLVGIPDIDAQHRELVSLVNRLARNILSGNDNLSATSLFNALSDYAQYHFSEEEKIWKRHLVEISQLDRHLNAHQGFCARLEAFQHRASHGFDEEWKAEVLSFLTRWLSQHILREDYRMAALVRQHAAASESSYPTVPGLLSKATPDRTDAAAIEMHLRIERQLGAFIMLSASRSRHESERKYRTVFESIFVPLVLLDASDGRIIDWNCAAHKLFGVDPADDRARFFPDLFPERLRPLAQHQLVRQIDANHGAITSHILRLDQQEVPVEIISGGQFVFSGQLQMVVAFHDLTEAIEHRQKLQYIAYNDLMTGLLNRAGICRTINQKTAAGETVAVVYINIDHFDRVNRDQGIKAADDLLIQYARKLESLCPISSALARINGDEFVAVVTDFEGPDELAAIASRMLQIEVPGIVEIGRKSCLTASIGIVNAQPGQAGTPDTMLREAAQAMYAAKLRGRHRIEFFDPQAEQAIEQHHRKLIEISRALEAGEFIVHYQPRVNLRTGRLLGCEALSRWQCPKQGLKAPAEFIPTLEAHPLLVTFDHWLIGAVLEQIRSWRSLGLDIPVSINIGTWHLKQPGFVDLVEQLLGQFKDIPAQSLEFEVLETTAIEDAEIVDANLHRIRALGCSLSIDDFGTGYSSLTYMKKVPADFVKIEKSFVTDMDSNPEDLAILTGILDLSAAFGRAVVAEGVETEEQGRILIELGCEIAQGYAIARPMPASELPDWVANWRPEASWTQTLPVNKQDHPAIMSLVEHRAWTRRFMDQTRSGPCMVPATAPPEHCRLQRWLETAQDPAQTDPKLALIGQLHAELHQMIERLQFEPRPESKPLVKEHQQIEALIARLGTAIRIVTQARAGSF